MSEQTGPGPRVEILYFAGCPGYARLRTLLERESLIVCTYVDQDLLGADDPRAAYSSPTLLVDGALVLGTRLDAAVGSCSVISARAMSEAVERLRTRFSISDLT